jgi:cytochrome P450
MPASTVDPDGLLADLLLTPEGRSDPYPLYRQLRETAPIHESAMGLWVVSRYDDVNEVLRNQRIGRDAQAFMNGRFGGEWSEHAALRRMASSMLWANPPEHTRLRRMVNHVFTPRRVASMKQSIEDLVHRILEPLAEAGGGDLLNDFAFPLPLAVVATLLGVPLEEAPALREPMRAFQRTFELGLTADELVEADEGAEFSDDYFTALIAERRANMTDDLLSALIAAEEEGDRLSAPELMNFCNMIIGAGFETATNMISHMVLHLVGHPDELRRVRENRALVPTAVDEVLRYDPPIQLTLRMTLQPLELRDVVIPAGQTVIPLLASANRDPDRFPDPDRFDVGRQDNAHLSFGAGIHHCLGWSLAKLEGDIVLDVLLNRFSDITITEQPVYRPRVTMRGLESLHVSLTNS